MHSGGSIIACTSAAAAAGRHDKKRHKSSEGQDMISDLPDFVIGRILSFLPTKYAVRTGALSQRWIYKWMFLTDLSFDYNHPSSSYLCEKRKTRFINFVYRVLLNLNTATIQTFSLDILHNFDPYHINQWISVVSNKRVKIIRVKLWKKCNLYTYPLFKCQSLEELKLQMLGRCILKFPNLICLSFIPRRLALAWNHIYLLYYAADCTWTGVKSVTLEAPLLEVVSLAYPFYSPPGHYESHAEIKLCASHLRKFSYRGNISSDTFVLDAADIGSANILMFNFEDRNVQETWIFICKLLTVNAKCLNLCLHADWQVCFLTSPFVLSKC
ncbi:putative F-box domain-containing protein [Medicago truncatula]|uniref:Putative F-box domain-containing protein n=1 Tax=Medicago truncatula TaxID=3880 RepID=A0A396JYY0_MEDTR|nr:putative F-box domain-containing protein [Medicago truncatula]